MTFIAAAMECVAERGRPCGVCDGCRKVRNGIHPDVVTVEDPNHKFLPVELIRQVCADAYIRPNEGRRKIYVFPDCGILPEAGQNVLLKTVEEGPAYAAFLFCGDHSGQLLQTLRSRCVELRLRGRAESRKMDRAAEEICRTLGRKRRGTVAELAVQLEKKTMKREQLQEALLQVRDCCAEALLRLYGKPAGENTDEFAGILAKNLTKNQIMRTIETLQKYIGDCTYNVGVGHVLGALAVELEDIL